MTSDPIAVLRAERREADRLGDRARVDRLTLSLITLTASTTGDHP